MKQTMFIFLAVLLCCTFTVNAQAQTQTPVPCAVDPDWTTAKLQEELERCRVKMQPEVINQIAEQITVERVSEYSKLAKGIAEAIGIAARETGLAVNEFLATDAGFMVAVLIVWKIIGAQIIGIVIGVIAMIAIPIVAFRAVKFARTDGYNYHESVGLFGITRRKAEPVLDNNIGEGAGFMIFAITIASMVLWSLALAGALGAFA